MKHFLRGVMMILAFSGWAVAAAQLDVTDKETGKDLVLGKGDALVVRLPANPSTGYSWYLAISKLGLLEVPGEGICEPIKSEHMVGMPQTVVWTLKAVKSGSLRITFSYIRPWEKGVAPLRMVSWPITVRS